MTLLSGNEGGAGDAGASGATGGASGGEAPPASAGAAAPGTSGASGGATATWRDSLPEEIRANPALSAIQDVGTLAKSYLHANSLIGKKGVIAPTDKSSSEEWDAFYTQIGRPPADKYEVKGPDGVTLDKDLVTKFKDNAYKAGLLPKQAEGLLNWYISNQAESEKAAKEASAQETSVQLNSLKKEWGQAFDDQVRFARAAVAEIGGPELAQHLAKTGLGNDVQLIKFMAKAGKLISEDKLRGMGATASGAKTPSELNAEMEGMFKAGSPLLDPLHGDHKKAVMQYEKLAKSLSPQ